MKVIIEDKKICGIPVLDIYSADIKEKMPIIIMLHRGNGRKEENIERAYKYVKEGYFVTLFDAYGHGELKNDNEKSEKMTIERFLKWYLKTSEYLNIIINSYGENVYTDSSRIGLIGVSMGACTIYYNILKEKNPNVKAAVAIIGSPDWLTFVRKNFTDHFSESEIVKMEEYVKKSEPLNYNDKLIDFPLLMLNGVEDEFMPINNVRQAYDILQKNYLDKNSIKLVEFEGIGHEATSEMFDIGFIWLKKYL